MIGIWIASAVILTSAYGGNLRAFFTTPSYTRAMDTLADLVAGELPWTMVIYGAEVETFLATSPDPVHSAFWKRKKVVGFRSYPFDRVGSHLSVLDSDCNRCLQKKVLLIHVKQ